MQSLVTKISESENIIFFPFELVELLVILTNQTAILLINRELSKYAEKFKDLFLRIALQRELKHVERRYIKRWCPYPTITVNQRMTDGKHNYRIIKTIRNKFAHYIHVDMHGNQLDDEILVLKKIKKQKECHGYGYRDGDGDKWMNIHTGIELRCGIV